MVDHYLLKKRNVFSQLIENLAAGPIRIKKICFTDKQDKIH